MVEEGEEDFETGNSQYFRLGILKKKEGRKEERKRKGIHESWHISDYKQNAFHSRLYKRHLTS
jgi:hypothetical protein